MTEAWDQLKNVVSTDDAQGFNSASTQDIYELVRAIEDEHAARRTLRNTRRIKPFLDRLCQYAKAAELLCEEAALNWIWAPVRLMVQVAAECFDALDKLLAEFGQIARVLPDMAMITEQSWHNPYFQQAFAMIYVDVLAFYRRVYGILQRPGMHQEEIIPGLVLTQSCSRVEDNLHLQLGPVRRPLQGYP